MWHIKTIASPSTYTPSSPTRLVMQIHELTADPLRGVVSHSLKIGAVIRPPSPFASALLRFNTSLVEPQHMESLLIDQEIMLAYKGQCYQHGERAVSETVTMNRSEPAPM